LLQIIYEKLVRV